ncbi:replicative DNA helicase [Helcococcus sueciensis]|uniref:replicative DNA helicase n=1 Tax=Helcococcus sueciensis TaxID=241555 RepID=UPI0004281C66|nr:replicative DNA helicase [Helcococcus sueciensis]
MENNFSTSDIKTEKAILGLAIVHNDLINNLMEKIKSEDFQDLRNALVFNAITQLNMDHDSIDFNMVNNQLELMGKLSDIGGETYVMELTDPTYFRANYDSYLEIVKEKSMRRKLLKFGDDVLNKVSTSQEKSEELIANFSTQLFNLSEYDNKEGLVRLSDTIEEAFNYMTEMASNQSDITGITTGFRDIDRQLSGFQNSDFLLLAARPSVGKTALGINMGLNAALVGKKVAVFSLEMSRRQIFQRILSIITRVELQDIISGNIKKEDWPLLYKSISKFQELDMYIDDTASISITELRAKSKRMKIEKGLDLIVIDYLQLMTADMGRNDNRQQEISNISRGLKALAKELNIPVLALSQLSRKSEERSNKRPMLSDLRESGAIEQDADVVMMLYREDYYDEDSEEQNIIEVITAKHRNGPTGTNKLYFKKENTSFHDFGKEDENVI